MPLMSHPLSRRTMLGSVAGAAALALARPAIAQTQPHVVIIGGGYGGASCARELRRIAPDIRVTLVEPNANYVAFPLGNAVITGLRKLSEQTFSYNSLASDNITLVRQKATAVDAKARSVTLGDGTKLDYQRLVLSPGIALRYDTIIGYSEQVAQDMPHAWVSGDQLALLAKQLDAMDDGGQVVISAPDNPMRCPLGVYERASLIAHYLKTKKPKSKVTILDAKDSFPQQAQFQAAWKRLYPQHLEWIGLSAGGNLVSIDAKAKKLVTDFGDYTASVANVIPPQKAGAIAEAAGVTDRTRWCPVKPQTFESTLQPGVHVIGDATVLSGVPKAAASAQSEAKICAAAVAAALKGNASQSAPLESSCYGFVAPDAAVSVIASYRFENGDFHEIPAGARSANPAGTDVATAQSRDARAAEAWFRQSAKDAFG